MRAESTWVRALGTCREGRACTRGRVGVPGTPGAGPQSRRRARAPHAGGRGGGSLRGARPRKPPRGEEMCVYSRQWCQTGGERSSVGRSSTSLQTRGRQRLLRDAVRRGRCAVTRGVSQVPGTGASTGFIPLRSVSTALKTHKSESQVPEVMLSQTAPEVCPGSPSCDRARTDARGPSSSHVEGTLGRGLRNYNPVKRNQLEIPCSKAWPCLFLGFLCIL